MKNVLIILIMLSAWTVSINAQNIVSNTNWELDESGQKIVVTYDLNRQGEYRYFDVKLMGIVDGIEFPARTVEGDVGPFVKEGRSKVIVWEIFKDLAEDPEGALSVKVTAENSGPVSPPEPPTPPGPLTNYVPSTVPVYAGLGGVVALGGGLLIGGASKASGAKKEYENDIRPKYEGIVGPDDPGFRQEYEEVNKRYKSGQVMMAGGAAIIVAGGVILVKRLITINKLKKTQRLGVQPYLDLNAPGSKSGKAVGLGLKYRF